MNIRQKRWGPLGLSTSSECSGWSGIEKRLKGIKSLYFNFVIWICLALASNCYCLLCPDLKSPTVSTTLFGMVSSCVIHFSVFCLAIKIISPGSHTVKDFLYPSKQCFFSLWSEISDFNTLKCQPHCLPSSITFSYCSHQNSMAEHKLTITHSICIRLLHQCSSLQNDTKSLLMSSCVFQTILK